MKTLLLAILALHPIQSTDFETLYQSVRAKQESVSGDLHIDMKAWLPFAVQTLRKNDYSKFSSDQLLRLAALNLFDDLPSTEDDEPRTAIVAIIEARPLRDPYDAMLKLRVARQSEKLYGDVNLLANLYDAVVTDEALKRINQGPHRETLLSLLVYYIPGNVLAMRPDNAKKIAATLPAEWPADWSIYSEALVQSVFTEKSVGSERREALRKAALDAIARQLADHPTGKMADFLKSSRARMEGAAASNKLIGSVPQAINIQWSSDPKIKSLNDLKGRVVVLDFWATWCGPCLASVPNLRELQKGFAGYPVSLLAITSLQGRVTGLEEGQIETKGNPKKEYDLTRKVMAKHGMSWPTVFTQEDVFNPEFGIRGIPFTAILDPAGKVRYANLHPGNDGAKIRKHIIDLLTEFNLKHP